jgi:hypothetical protein
LVKVEFAIGSYHDSIDCDVVPMQACSMLLGRPWQFHKDSLHFGKTNQHSFMHNDKKIVLHPMFPEAILRDELARASKLKNQEHVASENHVLANELEKQKKSTKSVHCNKCEIKLKGSCNLATKSNLDEIDASTTVCYVLVCKETLFSLDDASIFMPPAITNLLQEYANIFPKEVPPGLPPIRGIEHQIDLIPGASLPNCAPYRTNPEETKEIQHQVQELLDKGYGIKVDQAKVEAIHSWPVPSMVTQVWSFLGLVGFYRRFVKDFTPLQPHYTNSPRRVQPSLGLQPNKMLSTCSKIS